MRLEDMILVSIDDHAIEPPDIFERHVPDKYKAQAPRVVQDGNGADYWEFQGEATSTGFGLGANVGWTTDEWGLDPTAYAEIRPGCWNVHERIRDMNKGGILASMCFPTMPGFAGRTFLEAPDKDLSLVMLKAYNDWHIDDWCAEYPGRFIPLGIVPMWDVDLAVEEVKRLASKGCRAITFAEAPHAFGLPSYLSGYWDPMLSAMCDTGTRLCLHIGSSDVLVKLAPEAGPDHAMVLATQLTLMTAHDLLFGPTLRKFPELKVALSEGGIGWIPFYLDRIERHYANQRWIAHDFGGKSPTELFREQILACFITDPSALRLRDVIGVDMLAWECDYPHSDTTWPDNAEQLWSELTTAGATPDEIHKITWQNSVRFFDWDPFTQIRQEQATVGALRALATDVDTSRMPRAEWRKRNEANGIAV